MLVTVEFTSDEEARLNALKERSGAADVGVLVHAAVAAFDPPAGALALATDGASEPGTLPPGAPLQGSMPGTPAASA